MSEPRKAALSLLIAVLLFAVFITVSFTGVFDILEARFYNPGVTAAFSRGVTHEATAIEVFITTIERQLTETVADPSVKRSFLVNQTPEDIYKRSEIFTRLHEKIDGLQWARFIDAAGNRIHFSTWQGDFLRTDAEYSSYRMYTDAAYYQPIDQLMPDAGEDVRISFIPNEDRIAFSLLFYDALDAYRGIAVFSMSVDALRNRLIAAGAGQGKLWLTSNPKGILHGIPEDNLDFLLNSVSDYWALGTVGGKVDITGVEAGAGRERLVLLSSKTAQGVFTGTLVRESAFVISPALKTLFLALFFISVYIFIFLLINVRQDPFTVIQNRLKNLQVDLIREYYDQKSDVELNKWGIELLARREEIREELKAGLKLHKNKKDEAKINSFIDKSWSDLLAVIGGRLEQNVQGEELQLALNRLSNTLANMMASGVPIAGGGVLPVSAAQTQHEEKPAPDKARKVEESAVPKKASGGIDEAEIEELSELEEAEDDTLKADETAADAEGVTDAAPESVEELEVLDEVEELEEVEALEEAPAAVSAPAPQSTPRPSDRFDAAAREVEWGEEPLSETEEPLALELEITSPFTTSEDYKPKDFIEQNVFDDDEALPLESLDVSDTSPLLYKPFGESLSASSLSPVPRGLARRALKALEDAALKEKEESAAPPAAPVAAPMAAPLAAAQALIAAKQRQKEDSSVNEIIRESEGIAYIQEAALHPTSAEVDELDPRMKVLVDSVLQTD